MKKIYLFACATLLAFSGCTNEISEDGFVDKTNAISFNAYPTKSRALVAGDVTTDNMKLGNFGVVGYTCNDNNIYLFKKVGDDNKAVEQTYVPGSGSSSGTWEYANKGDLKFWPNQNMDFYAYFPYSDNATFENNNNPSDGEDLVMTIPNVDCSHDVLFASVGNQSKKDRVPLTFYHAFAKMKKLTIEMPTEGILYQSNCQIVVQKVEFINTSTKGDIQVDAYGIASYNVDDDDVTLQENLASPVTVNKDTAPGTLINNQDTESEGYFFATNNVPENNVMGTNKTMWDGVKGSIITSKLSTSGLVCLKLTCKVWNGTESKKYYYVGGDGDNYGEVYIPLKGTDSNSNSVTTFDAGKRYTYNIVMKDNIGYTDKGDPILTPILFSVDEVVDWTDVTVTITL